MQMPDSTIYLDLAFMWSRRSLEPRSKDVLQGCFFVHQKTRKQKQSDMLVMTTALTHFQANHFLFMLDLIQRG